MSRGFVKEDDQEEPPFVPPRASLPPGVDNYVTPEGLEALKAEREALIQSREETRDMRDRERRRAHAVIDVKLSQLDERIDSAQVVEPPTSPTEVRFGVTVSFRPKTKAAMEQRFQIVGVDEANIREGKVAFTAPIVQAMMGCSTGAEFEFSLAGNPTKFEVLKIE